MKKVFSLLVLPLIAFSSCVKEKEVDGEGYSIILESSVDKGVDKIDSRADITDTENVAAYWLTVTGPSNYSVDRALGTETTIKNLTPGEYTVELRSHRTGTYTLPAFNFPVYGASVTKTLLTDRHTPFKMECTQINTAVRFIFDESVTDYYTDPVATVTDAHGQSLSLTPADEGLKIAYFDPGTLKITLKAEGIDPIPIGGNAYREIDAEARQLRTITLRTSNYPGNTIEMEITVDDMVTEEKEDFGVGEVVGTGSADSPFSVSDAINAMPAAGVWVEGYVLGSTTLTRAGGEDNLVIGAEPESPVSRGIAVEVAVDEIRKALQLAPDADLKGVRVAFKGNVTGKAGHFTSPAFAAMTGVQNYTLNYFTDKASINTFYNDKVLKDAPFPVGAACTHWELEDDPTYIKIMERDFNSITATYTMKMEQIWKNESDFANYNFADADKLIAFAQKHRMRVHGHTLIWSQNTPQWLKEKGAAESWDQAKWTQVMEDYITKVVTHFAGKVASWDVVNEAFNDGDGTLRGTNAGADTYSFWYDKAGPDFIEKAFLAARRALDAAGDTGCKLFYNDYGLSNNATKRDGVAAYIAELQSKSVPIDGVGLQCHVEVFPDYRIAKESFAKFAAMGLLIHVSELDAALNNPALIEGGLLQGKPIEDLYNTLPNKNFEYEYWQGKSVNMIAKAYMDNVPQNQRFGITTWALTDRNSMVDGNHWGHPDWPGLFRKSYQPKRAYHGLLEGIFGTDWETEDDAGWDWRWNSPGGYEPIPSWAQ